MKKIAYGVVFLSLLLLQACQHDGEADATLANKRVQLRQAAVYNTQLGLAYLKQGDRERAKHKLLLALAEAPKSPDVQVAMAYFMAESRDWESARRYYKKAMTLAPGRGAYLNDYGVFLCRQGRYSEAQYYFLKAAADAQYEHTARAYENAGLAAEAAHDDKKARLYFVTALQQDPSREPSLYELVRMEAHANRVKHALFYLQQYSNMALHHRSLLAMGARLAHKAGQFELEKEYQSNLSLLG